MLLRKQRGEDTGEKKFEIQPLTKREKEVFYALYVLTEEKRYTTYKAVARRACYSENLVASYITNLIEKGIPIVKKYANRTAYLSLNPDFREIQAKENIVGVNTLLTHWVR
jgi:DNA-binding CsgD family transcriptional regulator